MILCSEKKHIIELKKFGYSFSAGMAILFTVSVWQNFHPNIKIIIAVLFLFHLTAAIVNNKLLNPSYKTASFLGRILGNTIISILLTIVYYFLFTPIALILRVFNKDHIKNISQKPQWIDIDPRKNDSKRVEKLY